MSHKRLTALAVAALGTVFGMTAQVGLRSDSIDALARQAWQSAQAPLFADTGAMSLTRTVGVEDAAAEVSLAKAFVGTLLVLECLPEDATSWNRAELQDVPLFKRWKRHVFDKGCEWDHDKFIFNYVLHPYAGAVYFMGARSVGFNFYQSLLYCTLISNVGWEFGIEAFMERPSYQDLFITPLVGSAIGEGFYMLKRHLVDNNYELAGSRLLGDIVAFLIDPVNEVIGIFDHNPARVVARAKAWDAQHGQRAQVSFNAGLQGLSLRVVF